MVLSTRPAAVAGSFYPAHSSALSSDVDRLLQRAVAKIPPSAQASVPKALVVPHAGYMYSGDIAATAYAQLIPARERIHRVILLGPAHRVYVDKMVLPGVQAFSTPLGLVEVDAGSVEKIQGFPQVQTMPLAHQMEHSLEVQLPFLQRVLPQFNCVPMVVGDVKPEKVQAVVEALWGGDETLILISSDLSHYHPYSEACALDRVTAQAIVDQETNIPSEGACGCMPLNGFLRLAKARALTSKLLDLRNSGDTAGDKKQVVGYGAFAFYESGGSHEHLA
jgi:MEMO1 family protein